MEEVMGEPVSGMFFIPRGCGAGKADVVAHSSRPT